MMLPMCLLGWLRWIGLGRWVLGSSLGARATMAVIISTVVDICTLISGRTITIYSKYLFLLYFVVIYFQGWGYYPDNSFGGQEMYNI